MGRFQLAPDAVPLLLQLASPTEKAEVLDRVCKKSGVARERLEEIFDALVDREILKPVETNVSQASEYSNFFGNLLNHRGMLTDTPRMAQFEKGIRKAAENGATVIDVGAGSGILSLFAARAGAARVYALEESRIIEDARKLAEANGLSEIIQFVKGDAAQFRPEKPVDLVMGEWMGMYLFDEWRHFETFAKVRDRLLKADGDVLPRSVQFYLVPINDNRLYQQCGLGFWETPVSGFDYTLGRQRQLERLRMSVVQADHHTFVAEPWEILDVDCRTDTVENFFFERSYVQEIEQPGCIDGLIGYFNLNLAPGIDLSTSPAALPTHWRQAYFPIERIATQPGDTVETCINSVKHARTGAPRFELTITQLRASAQIFQGSYQY